MREHAGMIVAINNEVRSTELLPRFCIKDRMITIAGPKAQSGIINVRNQYQTFAGTVLYFILTSSVAIQ